MAGIRDIAKAAGVKPEEVSDVFEAVFTFLRNGDQVRVSGFGSFDRKTFPGRTVESPVINDGKPTRYGKTYRIIFRTSDQAKRRLNMGLKKREAKLREAEAEEAKPKKKRRRK